MDWKLVLCLSIRFTRLTDRHALLLVQGQVTRVLFTVLCIGMSHTVACTFSTPDSSEQLRRPRFARNKLKTKPCNPQTIRPKVRICLLS